MFMAWQRNLLHFRRAPFTNQTGLQRARRGLRFKSARNNMRWILRASSPKYAHKKHARAFAIMVCWRKPAIFVFGEWLPWAISSTGGVCVGWEDGTREKSTSL